jgi:NitT/TauT family transport system substrate-binding protein
MALAIFSSCLMLSPHILSAKALEKVSVGVSPTTSTGGVFVAFEKGYFKEEGLDVDLRVFASSTAPMLPLLAKGDLDVGGGNITAGLFASNMDGAGVLLVADKGSVRKDADYLKLMIRTDLIASGRYKSYRDLKGMKVGMTVLGGTSQEAAFSRFLGKGGLRPSDVVFVKAGYAEAGKLFAAKGLDAFIQLEPYVTDLEKSGAAKVVDGLYSIHPGQQSAAIFYSPVFAAKKPEVATRFMKAYIRGCRDYNQAFRSDRKGEDFKQLVAILSKWTSIKDSGVYQEMVPAGLGDDGRLNVKALEEDISYFLAQKYLPSRPDMKKLIRVEFVEKALVELAQHDRAKVSRK